jgi:hypothetical protein
VLEGMANRAVNGHSQLVDAPSDHEHTPSGATS